MPIHLDTLTPSQVKEIIDLALRNANEEDRRHIVQRRGISADDTAHAPQHLVKAIDRLSPAAQHELMSLMWLGMGTIDADEGAWVDLLHIVEDEPFENVPVQLATTPSLHEYLHRGLGKVS